MSVLGNRPAPSKGRAKQRFFQILFRIEADCYVISQLPAEPSLARKAFRFRKLTAGSDPEQDSYDVRFTEHGPECDGKGFLRWRRCKHCDTIQAAARLFDLLAAPVPEPAPVRLPTDLEADFA
jgi:hypothetical protein